MKTLNLFLKTSFFNKINDVALQSIRNKIYTAQMWHLLQAFILTVTTMLVGLAVRQNSTSQLTLNDRSNCNLLPHGFIAFQIF